MATAWLEKVNEFLSCTICTDEYTDPCTLQCQHTFCRKCITQYTKTRPEALQSKTIPCPNCRQVTKVVDPSRPVDQWAWQIKPSIIIQGLIDTSVPGQTATGDDPSCSVCGHLGETTAASSWCPECETNLCDRCTRAHRATSSLRDHVVCDLSAKVKVKIRKVMCKEHTEERVEFHCKDCKKSACHTCYIIYHRACRAVVTIESMKSEMKSIVGEKRFILSKGIKGRSTKLTMKNDAIKKASDDKATMMTEIESVSQKAIDKIKQKEKHLLDKLHEASDKKISQLQADVKTGEIEIQMYRQHCEYIDQNLDADCVMDLYDLYHFCQCMAPLTGGIKKTDVQQRQDVDSIRFIPDTAKVQQRLGDLKLGEVDVIYQDQSGQLPTPVLVDTTDGRLESDIGDPSLIDITVLYVDGIQVKIVTDFQNECLKSFYTRNNQLCDSTLRFGNAPFGVIHLKENDIMVAVPNSQQILTVRVSPDLEQVSAITTVKPYGSLALIKSTGLLAAGCQPAVDILNMEGQILKSISTVIYVILFEEPAYLSGSPEGNILVSDHKQKSVTSITKDGHVVWKYSPTGVRALSFPTGITITPSGSILIADRDSSKIIELTKDGTSARDLITSQNATRAPLGLACDKYGFVYVCDQGVIKEFIFV